MKRILSCLSVAALAVVALSCNNYGLKKTKSGLLYKIISEDKNPVVKPGQFLKLAFVQKLRDSILYSSDSNMPAYVRIDTAGPAGQYSPVEVFPLLRKGDSAVIVQLADSLQKRTGQPLPPFLKKRDKIVLSLKVLDVFTTQEETEKDRSAGMEKFHLKESKEVEDYLSRNKITATKTAKGTYVRIDSTGNGPAVDSNKQVSVFYTGKLFPGGKTFESNVGKEPIKFVIGRHQIIPGWDDGLRLFKKGGRGTLYIPAFLAYDAQPGPGKTPNENLIFEIEVTDVTDAPAETPSMMPGGPGGRPGMPGGRPGMPGGRPAMPTRPAPNAPKPAGQ